MTDGTTKKKTQKKTQNNEKTPQKTLKRNPEAKCMVCTWLKNSKSQKTKILQKESYLSIKKASDPILTPKMAQ